MSQKQIQFNFDQLNLKLSFFYVQDANRGMRTPEKGGRLPTNISPITKTGQVKVTAINILFICWIEALDWSDGFPYIGVFNSIFWWAKNSSKINTRRFNEHHFSLQFLYV